jgi:uncharacterized OB-fold protein
MGFEKFGRVSFTADTRAAAFVDHLEQGKIMATKCKTCGSVYFPPKMDCPTCLKSDVEWVDAPTSGNLITYSTVRYEPTGFEGDAPYTIAVGDFGNGIKIFSRLSRDINEADIKTGMKLKLAVLKLPGDRISYEFQKA